MALNNTFLNFLADHAANRAWQVRPHTGAPGANGAANLAGAGLANVDMTAASWTDAANGDVANNAILDFGVPTAARTITHLGLWANLGAGLVYCGDVALAAGIQLAVGQPFQVAIGDLDLLGSSS